MSDNLIFYEHPNSEYFEIQYIKKNNLFFPLHFHDMIEIVYYAGGCVNYHVDGFLYTLHAGELAVVFPQLIHGFINDKNNAEAELYIIITDRKVYAELPFDYQRTKPAVPVVKTDEYRGVIENIIDIFHESEKDILIRYYIKILLIMLSRNTEIVSADEVNNSADRNTVNKLSDYISKHYRESLSLTDAAAAVGINKYSASKLLNNVMKINFYDILNKYRILYARNLLLTTDIKILEISEQCGFDSLVSFNRNFKKYMGVPPSEFRKDEKL